MQERVINIELAPMSVAKLSEERKRCEKELNLSQNRFRRINSRMLMFSILAVITILLMGMEIGANLKMLGEGTFYVVISLLMLAGLCTAMTEEDVWILPVVFSFCLMFVGGPILIIASDLVSVAMQAFGVDVSQTAKTLSGGEVAMSRAISILVILASAFLGFGAFLIWFEWVMRPFQAVRDGANALSDLTREKHPDACIELAQWRTEDTTIQRYLNQVVHLNRPILYGEYLAAQTWVINEPKRTADRIKAEAVKQAWNQLNPVDM